jgi:hypothetical protein
VKKSIWRLTVKVCHNAGLCSYLSFGLLTTSERIRLTVEIRLILGIGVLTILFAFFFVNNALKRDTGTAEMLCISNAIKGGAAAFLARQNKTIGALAIAASALTFLIYS